MSTERNPALVADRRAGMTYAELGDKYEISAHRCWQIVREQRARDERAERMARPRLDDYPGRTPVRDLPLGSRAINCLENAGRETVEAVRRSPDRELKSIPNLGPGRFREIRDLVPYRAAAPVAAEIER